MTTITDTKIISLNSENGILNNDTYLSSMSFTLLNLLKLDPNIIHTQLTLQSAQIPVSFYIVNYTNKTLVIRYSGVDYPISIAVGNYNANSLITALQTAITASIPALTITITISKITGIFTFTSSLAFTLRASLNTFTIGTILGMGKTDLAATLVSTTYTAVLPYPVNLLGIKTLQINSFTISGNNYASNLQGQSTLLATIPVQAPSFGLILYSDTGDTRVSFNNNTLDGIDINITDAETGKLINFNNCNWTMTLVLHITRLLPPTSLVVPVGSNRPQAELSNSLANPIPPKQLTNDEEELKILSI
jgi:hypothetical protein